jgi:hypothetical protein
MGKLLERLTKQLTTDKKQEAEDCIQLYNYLKETTGGVWESKWSHLTDVTFEGFPSDKRWYKPSAIGYLVIQSLNTQKLNEQSRKSKESV